VTQGGIPVVLVGLGEIGQAIARAALLRPELRIVAAVDPAPSRAGRSLGEVLGEPAPDAIVARSLREVAAAAKGGVVLMATQSRFQEVLPDLEEAVRAGLHVVSTTEELSYPTKANMRYARIVHQMAKKAKVAVLGTGIDEVYPRDHKKLAADILAQGGTLETQFLLKTPPVSENFPYRNRIISGLSLGVVVVEAAENSRCRNLI
jgi:hypothetical protein